MAETLTTRLGLRLFGASTDTWSRTEHNADTAILEDLVAIDQQGALGSRPAAGIRGRYWTDSTTFVIYRDTGSAWKVVGAAGLDGVFTASATSTVPLTAAGIASQSANLFEAKVVASVKASIDKDGDVTAASYSGAYAALIGTAAGTVVLSAKGAASQSADVVSVVDSADATLFKVSPAGNLTSPFLQAATGRGLVGGGSLSNVTQMTLFTGTPAFEVLSTEGGASSTFSDMLYLHHGAADGTAATRRLGLVLHVGEPGTAGDAAKSAALYIESSAASFASPSFIIARGDAALMTFPASGAVVLARSLSLTPTANLTIAPGTAQAAIVAGNTAYGVQASDSGYARVASAGSYYVYGGGVHSDTAGSAGAGGVVLATFATSSGAGLLTMSRVHLLAGSDSLKIGSDASTRLVAAPTAIQAYNVAAVSTLTVNAAGGDVTVGDATDSAIRIRALTLGFFGAVPVVRQTVTGSRGGNAALASVLTALSNLGLIIDSSS